MKKGQIYKFIKHKLSTNPSWQVKGLLAIFDFQTQTEQNAENTIIHNDVGFTGCDAHILTSFAKQWLKRQWLSNKQMSILSHKMPKYWKQIYNISNKQKLEEQTAIWIQEQPAEQLNLNLSSNLPEVQYQPAELVYDSGEE